LLKENQEKPEERATIFQRGTRGDEYKDDVAGAKRAQRKKQKSHQRNQSIIFNEFDKKILEEQYSNAQQEEQGLLKVSYGSGR
jgi:hypothetical protein